MLKKTITYEDFNGNEITEDFYFNLSKAELAEMHLSQEGGLVEHITKIAEKRNGAEVIAAFKSILSVAVGRRSEDGKRFVKNQDITDEFMQSNAYSVLFMELVTESDSALTFMRGIVPADLASKVDKGETIVELPAEISVAPTKTEEVPPWIAENREPTKDELIRMTRPQLLEVMKRKTEGQGPVTQEQID